MREKREYAAGFLRGVFWFQNLSIFDILGKMIAKKKGGGELRGFRKFLLWVLMVLLFGAALVVIGRRTVARLSRTWTKWAVRVCAVLCLMALTVWGLLFLVLSARPETTGTINGQKLVMQRYGVWSDSNCAYYAYRGPFVIAEQNLGWSQEPWQDIHWDKTD